VEERDAHHLADGIPGLGPCRLEIPFTDRRMPRGMTSEVIAARTRRR
jgi:hypothetical protein